MKSSKALKLNSLDFLSIGHPLKNETKGQRLILIDEKNIKSCEFSTAVSPSIAAPY